MPPRGCTCLKCTNQARCAQTELSILLVQLRQLHPLDCTLRFPFACKVRTLSAQAKGIFPKHMWENP